MTTLEMLGDELYGVLTRYEFLANSPYRDDIEEATMLDLGARLVVAGVPLTALMSPVPRVEL